MRTSGIYYLLLFTLSCTLQAFAQTKQSPATLLPQNQYSFEIGGVTDSVTTPGSHFWLLNKQTQKRTQVLLPGKGIVNKAEFVNEYVAKISVVYNVSALRSDKSDFFYLFSVDRDTGAFLYDHYKNKYDFSELSVKPCFINANYNVYDKQGNHICSNVWVTRLSNSYELQCMNLKYPEARQIYSLDCKRTSFAMPGATKIHDLNNHMAYMWGDTLIVFNISSDKLKGKYLTVPLQIRDGFYKAGFEPTYDKLLDNEKFFPASTGPQLWTYINEKGEYAFKPLAADLALPFMLPAGQAPVRYQGKWGIINKQGATTHAFQFDSLALGKSYKTTRFIKQDSIFVMNDGGSLQPEGTAAYKHSATPTTDLQKEAAKIAGKYGTGTTKSNCIECVYCKGTGKGPKQQTYKRCDICGGGKRISFGTRTGVCTVCDKYGKVIDKEWQLDCTYCKGKGCTE
ncbi:MAG: hypothetical protein IPH78_04555 [Bacteroidetes bacterium]|nr:hypothetical protein [Bacteroidota bacterium]